MRVSQTGSKNVQSTEVTGSKGLERASQTKGARKAKEAAPATGAGESAQTAISSKAKEFAKAQTVASSAPDVREEKIAELRKRIAAGKYKIDDDAIAGRMVDEHSTSGIG
jgi:negative regulator of flagellin synthesis FlgM